MEASTNATTPASAAAISPALLVGLPLIIVIFAVIIVLLLVLGYISLRSRTKMKDYQGLPQDEAPNIDSLPYPPAIKLKDPPKPSMSFHMATKLSDPKTTGSRYPFVPHQSPATPVTIEKQPRRLRRKSNQKQEKGARKPLNSAAVAPEIETEKQGESGRKPSVMNLGGAGLPGWEYKPHMYLVPTETPGSGSTGAAQKDPVVNLSLLYNKDTTSLVLKIERVLRLPFREDGSEVDAYVRLFIIPKLAELPQRRTCKTRTVRKDADPVFDEEISYNAMSAEEMINSTLHVQVLDYRSYGKHHIIGQADLPLAQVQFKNGEAPVVLPLQSPKSRENLGTVLISICYSPETKKLGIILLRAKDLNKSVAKSVDPQAKLWVSLGDKTLGKLKTKKKCQSCSPIFNEALTCTVEPHNIRSVLLCVVLNNEHRLAPSRELGQVMMGTQATGEEFRHWNDVMAAPGKHIAEWHDLRSGL